jgi:hypothetical protein
MRQANSDLDIIDKKASKAGNKPNQSYEWFSFHSYKYLAYPPKLSKMEKLQDNKERECDCFDYIYVDPKEENPDRKQSKQKVILSDLIPGIEQVTLKLI